MDFADLYGLMSSRQPLSWPNLVFGSVMTDKPSASTLALCH